MQWKKILTKPEAANQLTASFSSEEELTANHRKLSILNKENRKNDDPISKICDKQINFIREQNQKKQLERPFIFFTVYIKQRLGKIIIANFNSVCSINFASYIAE